MPLPFNAFLQHPADGGIVIHQPHLQRFRVHTESMGREITKMVLPGRAVEFDEAAVAAHQILGDPQDLSPLPSARPDTSG